jgi:putative ABC transport system permease protein
VLQDRFGVYVASASLSAADAIILGAIVLSGLAIGLIPAVRAYRNTLSDGLQLRM